MSMIIQHAVQTHEGRIIVNEAGKDVYPDSSGTPVTMYGGLEYLHNSSNFPGKGCTDLTLTSLSSEDDFRNKLLLKDGQYFVIKDHALSLSHLLESNLLSNEQRNVLNYWITMNQIKNTDL